MKQLVFILSLLLSLSLHSQTENDKKEIKSIIKTIAEGWKERDVAKTTKHYDDKVDWTNAFGDRMQSKADLKTLLTEIYSLDFVMKGKSESQYKDINFLTPEIAIVRSKTVVKGQEWGDGTAMKDRHNHHLMVFQKKDKEWKVISHLISQAWIKK
ncbi:YybH family protein [Flavivirga rizhaonensis]|uniref:Nuclear transport factor 2 family protein n=1 Tax=Flavivirga rizhaonensis TaxID=2559571 RepID=A0A4S1E0D9_9FLAO|nr:SgcJ/EcaC family oxidoreductase [Flavivirga rizhaonensis]TGV03358.1 nuclear transport factor 2 family protein [Flavivirga rizhaonensis]